MRARNADYDSGAPEGGPVSGRIVVVGASAGGVEALTGLVRNLPGDLPAPVLVVLHVPPTGTTVLPQILSRAGPLPARHAEDGETLQAGAVCVAPSDCHLLVLDGVVRLERGPKENGHRPAIDPLFRTAARAFGARAIGVLLSGVLDDGSAGLKVVKSRGGTAIVQDPDDALYGTMPARAIEYADPDYVLPVAEIGPRIAALLEEEMEEGTPSHVATADALLIEEMLASEGTGQPSGLTCPECNGALWEVKSGDLLRYRCRVGHAFTQESLLALQGEALEAALWSALRALEEQAVLARRLAQRTTAEDRHRTATFFTDRADEAEQHASVIRRALTSMESTAPPPESAAAAEQTG